MKTTDLALNIFKHYRDCVNPFVKHYYGIIANYGLVDLAEAMGSDSEAAAMSKQQLAYFPDGFVHPRYNFPSYTVGGIAKSRAVYNGSCADEDQIRQYAESMMTDPRSSEGILSSPVPDQHEKIWIDVATAVTPYLLFAGLHFNRPEWIDEAVFQTIAMYDVFRNPENGLLHQGKNFLRPGFITGDHWGRGNGWGILPLADLCAYLPDEHPEKEKCIRYLKDHCEALLPYQTVDGMWRQEISIEFLNGVYSYEETSGTGLILYAIGESIRSGVLEREKWLPVFKRGLFGLTKYSIESDFSISNSCPGCRIPGDGSMFAYVNHKPTFRDEPHGAGPVILALAEAYRLGITDVELRR